MPPFKFVFKALYEDLKDFVHMDRQFVGWKILLEYIGELKHLIPSGHLN